MCNQEEGTIISVPGHIRSLLRKDRETGIAGLQTGIGTLLPCLETRLPNRRRAQLDETNHRYGGPCFRDSQSTLPAPITSLHVITIR
jgi:hypothetical protein